LTRAAKSKLISSSVDGRARRRCRAGGRSTRWRTCGGKRGGQPTRAPRARCCLHWLLGTKINAARPGSSLRCWKAESASDNRVAAGGRASWLWAAGRSEKPAVAVPLGRISGVLPQYERRHG